MSVWRALLLFVSIKVFLIVQIWHFAYFDRSLACFSSLYIETIHNSRWLFILMEFVSLNRFSLCISIRILFICTCWNYCNLSLKGLRLITFNRYSSKFNFYLIIPVLIICRQALNRVEHFLSNRVISTTVCGLICTRFLLGLFINFSQIQIVIARLCVHFQIYSKYYYNH